MNISEQTNFYVVSQRLSVIKCDSFEDCVTYDDFFYAIKELAGDVESFNVELLDASGDKFVIEENGWKVASMKAESLQKGSEIAQIYISGMIADPMGNVDVISSNRESYKGIIQIHQRLRYLSLSTDWSTANKRQYHIDLKKIFTRLKNGHLIHYSIYINPDDNYAIDLCFENELFVLNRYIEEGDSLLERKNEERYTNADFYQFIKFVLKKCPEIDLSAC